MVYPVLYPSHGDSHRHGQNVCGEIGEDGDLLDAIAFSPTLGRVTTGTFSLETSGVTNSSSSGSALNQRSYIPTPHGVSRAGRTSVNLLSTTSPKLPASQPVTTPDFAGNRLRVSSKKHLQRPFLTKNDSSPASLTPPLATFKRRESGAKITQHQLMAPLPPPIPRSNTMGLLINDNSPRYSPRAPSFARPTSSSAAKHRERIVSGEKRRLTINTPTAPNLSSARVSRISSNSWSKRVVSSGKDKERTPTSANATNTERQQDLGTSVEETTMPTAAIPTQAELPIMTPRVNTLGRPVRIRQSGGSSGSSIKAGPSSPDSPLMNLDSIDELERLMERAKPTFESPTVKFDEMLDAQVTAGPSSPESETSRASTPTPENLNIRQVTTALPDQEWLGRVFGLTNRFRTEEMNNAPPRMTPPSSMAHGATHDFNHGMHDEERRVRRVFIHLNSLCITDEARSSLAEFKVRFEARVALEEQWERGEVRRPKKENTKPKKNLKPKEESGLVESVVKPKNEVVGAKAGGVQKQLSVFERLLARKKKGGRKSSSAHGEAGPSNQ